MNTSSIIGIGLLATTALVGMVYMGTYNGFQKKDEGVKASERTIASCYQKRADLITNLASTVERYAGHENSTFTEVTKMRAGVGSVKLPENATPEQMKEWSEAQKVNSGALSRLLAVSENYPNLKADKIFLDLTKNLRDVEQQCALLRQRYISSVAAYNSSVRTFPSNIVANIHDIKAKEQLQFDDEAQNKRSPRVFEKK